MNTTEDMQEPALSAISPEQMQACLHVLQQIADDHGTIVRDARFNSLVSKVYRQGKRRDRKALRASQQAADHSLKASAAMVQWQRDVPPAPLINALLPLPPQRTLNQPENCYVCKQDFRELHFFYHLLCPKCAAFHYQMRVQRADLTGRTALVTGGRVKIGHQTVLRLLRDGARVMVTTRFPHAAARRFHAEPDADRVAGAAAAVWP